MKALRLFLAVTLPPEIKKTCREIIHTLKTSDADVNWVPEDNFHVTLKFLGDVSQDKVGDVTDVCRRVAAGHPAFTFSLGTLGAFPSLTAPRILWVGAQTDQDPFGRLAADITTALEHLGFKTEKRPFHPHITLGRIRSERSHAQLISTLHSNKNAGISREIPAQNATLFESTLTPHGAVYTARATLPFTP